MSNNSQFRCEFPEQYFYFNNNLICHYFFRCNSKTSISCGPGPVLSFQKRLVRSQTGVVPHGLCSHWWTEISSSGFFSAMKSLESSILASRILLWRILGLRSLSRRAAGIWGLWIVFHGPAGLGSLSHLSPCNPTIILSSCVLGALLAGVPTWKPVGDRVCGDPVPAPGTPPALLFVLETEKVLSNSMLRFRKYGAAFTYW